MFFIWGWGKDSMEHVVGPTERVLMVFSYVHLWWILRASWGRSYQHARFTEAGWATVPITPEFARQLCGGVEPQIPLWKKWSLAWAASGMALLVAFGGVLASLSR